MNRRNSKQNAVEIDAAVAADPDLMRRLVERTVQDVLETERTEALGAGKSERPTGRLGYRSGYYPRVLHNLRALAGFRRPKRQEDHRCQNQ